MDVFSQWRDALAGALEQTLARLALYLPNVLGALLLLLTGWLLALVLRAVAVRLTLLGERALQGVSRRRGLAPAQLPGASAKIFGGVVFWVVLLFFLTAATQVLGLATFTAWLARIVEYLPTMFAGVLIIVAGFLLGRLARELTETALGGTRQRALVGRMVQTAILVIAILVGAEQIGIKVTFLVILAAAAGIALAGAVALALSLGARGYVANLIGAHYLRQRYSVGEKIRVAGYEGRILEMTDTCVVLETAEGRANLPARVFSEQTIVQLVSGQADG